VPHELTPQRASAAFCAEHAGVLLRSAAFFACRAWLIGTAASCVLGVAGGALAATDMLVRNAARGLAWLDRRAASSAGFTAAASLVLPAAVPAAALVSSAVYGFYLLFGGVFGLVLGVAGGPVLALQAAAAAARAAARAADAAAALAAAAVAAAAARAGAPQ
jgi:hypothetical protein